MLRKDLATAEYVTSQQIRSLYSRWAKLYKQGKLTVPSQEDEKEMTEEKTDDEYEADPEDDAQDYLLSLCSIAKSMIWRIDQWVAVVYDERWYIGVVEVPHSLIFLFN